MTSTTITLLFFIAVSFCFYEADQKVCGEDFTFSCPEAHDDPSGVTVFTIYEEHWEILYYYYKTKKLTLQRKYKGRVTVNEQDKKALTITITNVQLNDTGSYWCVFSENKMARGKVFFLQVNEPEIAAVASSQAASSGMNLTLMTMTVMTMFSVVLLLLIVVAVWLIPKIKSHIRSTQKVNRHAVYEDMSLNRKRLNSLNN